MELKNWTYEEMPEYEGSPSGAAFIDTTGDEIAIEYLPNVIYASTPQGDLKLQILVPYSRNCHPVLPSPMMKDADGNYPEGVFDGNPKHPCVVYVQGSAWFPQNLYGKLPSLASLAEKGYVVALVEYRDSLRASFPTPILDCLNAVRYLRLHAKEYAIDSENMFVAGDSSGGHTAVMAGFWCKEDHGDNYYPGVSAEVKGIINLYGSTDFTFPDSNPITPTHNTAKSPEGMEMGGVDMTPEMVDALSCKTYVRPEADIPPMLIFHGTKDRIVNTRCSVYLYEKLKECGKEAELYLIRKADHGGSEFWTPTMISIMDSFMKSKIQ